MNFDCSYADFQSQDALIRENVNIIVNSFSFLDLNQYYLTLLNKGYTVYP